MLGLPHSLKNIDIYLLDQIIKKRISKDYKILDYGCGEGRNLDYFIENDFKISACDINNTNIRFVKSKHHSYFFLYPFRIFNNDSKEANKSNNIHQYDYIICNAVLHFSKNREDFIQRFFQIIRFMKKDGILFLRMTSNFGLQLKDEDCFEPMELKDNTIRFLITMPLLNFMIEQFNLKLIDPIKSVLVEDKRSMSIIILKKL